MTSIESAILRSADAVVVIHDRFAKHVVRNLHVRPERVHVVRNWSHVEVTAEADRAAVRDRLGWTGSIVALHAGNLGVKQGLETLLEAARIAEERGTRVKFVLMGGGSQKAKLQTMAAGIGTVEIRDPLPDGEFLDALRAADVLLVNELPGVAEMAVPSKLTSYFAAGRPVIAATGADGITAEEIRSADAGVVVPAGYAGAIVDAVLRLAADPEESNRLGTNGQRYRAEVLSEDVAVDKFMELLSDLAANGAQRRRRTGAARRRRHTR